MTALAVLSAIFGFVSPFIPELVKLGRGTLEHRQEMDRMRLSAEIAEKRHAWRMAEIEARADIAEMQALHRPVASFGVQILDAAKSHALPGWVVTPVFWAFALLDVLSGLVRPGVTYAVVGFYIAYKAALYATLTGPRFEAEPASAVVQLWTPDDMALVMYVLMFWFGQRAAKAAFGGNASHGAAGR